MNNTKHTDEIISKSLDYIINSENPKLATLVAFKILGLSTNDDDVYVRKIAKRLNIPVSEVWEAQREFRELTGLSNPFVLKLDFSCDDNGDVVSLDLIRELT
jgi:hypothetical protein